MIDPLGFVPKLGAFINKVTEIGPGAQVNSKLASLISLSSVLYCIFSKGKWNNSIAYPRVSNKLAAKLIVFQTKVLTTCFI